MTTIESYSITVVLRESKGREITSPGYKSREEADRVLGEIRDAQQNGDWIDLDWLSMSSSHIVAAHIEDRSVSFGFA
jgi:hypothetical protein